MCIAVHPCCARALQMMDKPGERRRHAQQEPQQPQPHHTQHAQPAAQQTSSPQLQPAQLQVPPQPTAPQTQPAASHRASLRCPPCDEVAPPDDHLQTAYRQLLISIGENPHREGLARTPARAAAAMRFLTSGYGKTAEEVTAEALFNVEDEGGKSGDATNLGVTPQPHQGMVVMRDVPIFSLCEHHLLPFWGKASIAYLPGETVIGLSKMARLADVFARRLQIQVGL